MICTVPAVPLRSVAIDPSTASFVLIEDDPLLLDLIVIALKAQFKPARFHSFTHGREGLEFCRVELPALVIVDLGLPDMDGRAVIRALLSASPETRIIVLTGQGSSTLPRELIALGVSGYIDKTSPLETMHAAVKRVLEGGIYFSASIRPAPSHAPFATDSTRDVPPEALTPREREIARLVAGGLISKEIGERLNLSRRTVEKARAEIVAKLNVRDLPGLVRWCMKHGLA
jgi:DNA-binding NarL/FixJ family response regulator